MAAPVKAIAILQMPATNAIAGNSLLREMK